MKAKALRSGNFLVFAGVLLVAGHGVASGAQAKCRRVEMQGQVESGREWRQPIGRGWVFRIIPIKPGAKGYSGWDLVVDRAEGAGFPDALFVATPPYDSISQREVGTTFGLRAQDAIGWNPRSFQFLTNPSDLRKAQKLYFALHDSRAASRRNGNSPQPAGDETADDVAETASRGLIELAKHSANGEFRILGARITPGTADALPYAQNWALQERDTPHTIAPASPPTPYGILDSIKFEIVLWLPLNWKTPRSVRSEPAPCR